METKIQSLSIDYQRIVNKRGEDVVMNGKRGFYIVDFCFNIFLFDEWRKGVYFVGFVLIFVLWWIEKAF